VEVAVTIEEEARKRKRRTRSCCWGTHLAPTNVLALFKQLLNHLCELSKVRNHHLLRNKKNDNRSNMREGGTKGCGC
jgi:hypothetical protein